jgi:hypothetical protein
MAQSITRNASVRPPLSLASMNPSNPNLTAMMSRESSNALAQSDPEPDSSSHMTCRNVGIPRAEPQAYIAPCPHQLTATSSQASVSWPAESRAYPPVVHFVESDSVFLTSLNRSIVLTCISALPSRRLRNGGVESPAAERTRKTWVQELRDGLGSAPRERRGLVRMDGWAEDETLVLERALLL